MHSPPSHLHPVITIGPFAKWGINFMMCNPHSTEEHAYIIIAMDYFTKWVEAMPTLTTDGKTAAQFLGLVFRKTLLPIMVPIFGITWWPI